MAGPGKAPRLQVRDWKWETAPVGDSLISPELRQRPAELHEEVRAHYHAAPPGVLPPATFRIEIPRPARTHHPIDAAGIQTQQRVQCRRLGERPHAPEPQRLEPPL